LITYFLHIKGGGIENIASGVFLEYIKHKKREKKREIYLGGFKNEKV
jgi:hypothetical protein